MSDQMHSGISTVGTEIDGALGASIGSATRALLGYRQPDGHWVFELEADCTIPAEYVLLRHYLGEPVDSVLEAKIANYLRRVQGAHGGWPLVHDGDFDMSASVKAYFALKMIGDSVDAPHMVRARDAMRSRGGKIQRIFGLLQGALRKIAEGTAVLDEADAAVASHEIVFVRARGQKFLEQRTVVLVASRIDVRDVVGDDVELPFQDRLPRKSDEKRILHRSFSPERSAACPPRPTADLQTARLSQAAVRRAHSESRAILETINFTMA
jgi:hypothetical protein